VTSRRSSGVAPALLALALVACMQSGSGSNRLEVRAPSWTLAGRPLVVEARTHGALELRDVTLTVVVGLKVVGRWPTHAGAAHIEVPTELVPPGRQTVTVKSGSESVAFRVRVVPVWQAALALVGALAALWVSARLALRRP